MLTRVESELLAGIMASGGTVTSLFKLSAYIGLAYNNAYHSARRLEERGVLSISKPGRALVLSIAV